jgi:hypothetical protein
MNVVFDTSCDLYFMRGVGLIVISSNKIELVFSFGFRLMLVVLTCRQVITEGPSSLISRTKTMSASSTLQVKETLRTHSSVTRNAAVEHLVWSPALIVEIVITLFEKFLYILLYSLSLLLRLLCSQPFHKLFRRSGTKTLHNPDNETDLLGLHEQASNRPSMSLSLALWRVGSVGSLFIRRSCSFQVKNFQHGSPQVKDLLVLEDLIDFSEPAARSHEARPVDSAPAIGIAESTPADVVCNERKMDSMVEKCLAELAASSPELG